MNKSAEKAEALPYPSIKKLGVTSVAETLHLLPRKYNDYTRPFRCFADAALAYSQQGLFDAAENMLFIMSIKYINLYTSDKAVTKRLKDAFRVDLILEDNQGILVKYTIFGNVWSTKDMHIGDEIAIYGKPDSFNGTPQIADGAVVHKSQVGKVYPVYKGVAGQVAGKTIEAAVYEALSELDVAGELLVNRANLNEHLFMRIAQMSPATLLKRIHLPSSVVEAEAACAIARKLTTYHLLQQAKQVSLMAVNPKASIRIEKSVIDALVARLPFKLTQDQYFGILEIVKDLNEQRPSRILLSADVGTGKSVVFMIPIVAAFLSACRVCILAPTTLLAEQLCSEINSYFPEAKSIIVNETTDLNAHKGVFVGTTALLFAKKRGKFEFDLVVNDEQHRFGVEQKEALLSAHTNLIESTATPIPRSMAMVSYGSYKIVSMRECPVHKEIKTIVASYDERVKLLDFVGKVIERKGQVAIVYPDVNNDEEETSAVGRENVKDAAKRWGERYPGRVASLYGAMKEDEKKLVIDDFKSGKYDILIASTVIEVGLTLPDLKAIIIVNADCFGMAQLHQLRGRVARKGGKGYCFVLPPKKVAPKGLNRLTKFSSTTDGFELAEIDMEERGFGEFDAEQGKQKGKSSMLFFNAKIYKKDIEEAQLLAA